MKKIISSILAASFIFATCAINVMAAPTTRTVTAKATPATDLEVGSNVVVEVVLDQTLNLGSANYEMSFDPEVFSVDTNKTSRVYNFVDAAWFKDIKDADGDFAYFMGTSPLVNVSEEEGWISIGWSGDPSSGSGIDAESAKTDRVIGKYTLTVKAIPESGSSVIGFNTVKTAGYMENTADTVNINTATVNFKSEEPEKNEWNITITEEAATGNNKLWKVAPEKTGTVNDIDKFEMTFTDGEGNTTPRYLSTDALKKIANDWNMTYNFFIGLITDRAGVTAAWDITAGGSTVNVIK